MRWRFCCVIRNARRHRCRHRCDLWRNKTSTALSLRRYSVKILLYFSVSLDHRLYLSIPALRVCVYNWSASRAYSHEALLALRLARGKLHISADSLVEICPPLNKKMIFCTVRRPHFRKGGGSSQVPWRGQKTTKIRAKILLFYESWGFLIPRLTF